MTYNGDDVILTVVAGPAPQTSTALAHARQRWMHSSLAPGYRPALYTPGAGWRSLRRAGFRHFRVHPGGLAQHHGYHEP